MLATYHTHSSFSDGKATIAQMVQAAAKQGIDVIGISDHLTLLPSGREISWSMKTDDLSNYVQTIAEHQSIGDQKPQVLLGVELDWFEGQNARLKEVIEAHPFDYVIGSVHFIGSFGIDGNPHRWANLLQPEIDEIHSNYWKQMKLMAQSGLFDIAAHLDLPKKFGYLPRTPPTELIHAALDALAEHNIIVELNTAGWHKVCADAYPSLDILRQCQSRDIAVTLSSDAHRPDHLLRDFVRGAERLHEAGYEQVARVSGGNITYEPLETAITGLT